MTYCRKCGKQIEEGAVCSCSADGKTKSEPDKAAAKGILDSITKKINIAKAKRTWESMKNRMGIGSPERNAVDTYERNMNIVPDCVKPNENEIPVRQYNIAVLRNQVRFERAEGHMQVTNKRVLFRAAGRSIGGRTAWQQEFAIDELAGIEAQQNYRFGLIYLIIGILTAGILLSVCLGIFASIDTYFIRKNSESKLEAVQELNRKYQESIQKAYVELLKDVEEIKEKYSDDTKKTQEEIQKLEEKYQSSQQAGGQKLQKDIQKKEDGRGIFSRLFGLVRLIIGLAGIAAFFYIYRNWLLKMAILGICAAAFLRTEAFDLNKVVFVGINLLLLITFLLMIFGLAMYSLKPNLVLLIKTKGGTDGTAPIRIIRSRGFWAWRQDSGTGFSEVFPTEESNQAIREINAMISDIQQLGDFGLEKWKNI